MFISSVSCHFRYCCTMKFCLKTCFIRHIKSLFHESLFPGGEFNGSLRGLMDYALLYAGSSFTVGVAEEECDTASLTKMVDAPEGTHKMAEATTHHQFPESHNMPAKPGSAHVVPTEPGSAHVMPAEPGSAHVMAAEPGSAHVMPAEPGPARVMSATPGSLAKMATTPADSPLWPGLIACVLDAPLVSVRAAGIPRAAALTAPEPAPSQELAESAPEPAPSQELAESAPEPAPSQELAESAPEPAPSQELTESAPQPVPPSSPSSPLVPPSSPSSPLVPPSSPSPLVLSSLAHSERPRDSAPPECPLTFAPPECPLEVVEFPKNFLGGSFPPLLTETPDPPWPMESPDPSWLPEALDLPWPPKLPASVLETICALSASCVSVSSRSQSLPWVSAPLWRVPAPPWRAPAPVSSAPPWWAPVSSALPICCLPFDPACLLISSVCRLPRPLHCPCC